MADHLTKADTVALWHAVDALAYQCRAMKDMDPPIDMDVQKAEWERLTAARRALRKVNAIRKEEAPHA